MFNNFLEKNLVFIFVPEFPRIGIHAFSNCSICQKLHVKYVIRYKVMLTWVFWSQYISHN